MNVYKVLMDEVKKLGDDRVPKIDKRVSIKCNYCGKEIKVDFNNNHTFVNGELNVVCKCGNVITDED